MHPDFHLGGTGEGAIGQIGPDAVLAIGGEGLEQVHRVAGRIGRLQAHQAAVHRHFRRAGHGLPIGHGKADGLAQLIGRKIGHGAFLMGGRFDSGLQGVLPA